MTLARANSSNVPNVRRTRDPSIDPPAKFQRILKEPGTKKLVCGEWITVKEDDEDAIAC